MYYDILTKIGDGSLCSHSRTRGLCMAADYAMDNLPHIEKSRSNVKRFKQLLEEYKPKTIRKVYWWDVGNWEPRENFIKDQLKLLKTISMKKRHWNVVLNQVGKILFMQKTPAYGIAPFLWEVHPDGAINQFGTLLNYLDWTRSLE